MRKVIAYSGGIDSTARAIALLRDHPEVEWTLLFFDMGQTSAAAQRAALDELVRRYPAFASHVVTIDLGYNPTTVTAGGLVLQAAGVLPVLFAFAAHYAAHVGADEVYTGYDRWPDDRQDAYDLVIKSAIVVDTVPVVHFGAAPRGIAGTLEACGLTWADVSFSVSCSGDPSDPLNPARVPCGVCPKCRERAVFDA